MKSVCCLIVLINVFFSAFLTAAEIYDFIPRHSQQALQINLDVLQGMESFQDDMVRNVFRHSGIDNKKYNTNEFNSLIEKIIIVTPVLTEDRIFVLIKTRMPEQEFCRRLEEITGIRQTIAGTPPAQVRTVTFSESELFSGLPYKKRTFAFTFLKPDIAVFAKNDLTAWRQYGDRGLPEQSRKKLAVPKALAAGFLKTSPEFLADNPLLPQILKASYAIFPGPAKSLVIKAAASCADEKSADLTQKQFQQYIMVGGIVLNQVDPELMQDWLSSVRINREKNRILLNAFFTRQFLTKLENASGKLSENMKSNDGK